MLEVEGRLVGADDAVAAARIAHHVLESVAAAAAPAPQLWRLLPREVLPHPARMQGLGLTDWMHGLHWLHSKSLPNALAFAWLQEWWQRRRRKAAPGRQCQLTLSNI